MEAQDSAESMVEPSRERLRFPKRERLKGRDEIKAVFNRRMRFSCPGVKLFVLKNGLSYNRIAFTFVRKFGSAVERNRSRRISREAYRHLRQFIKPGWDLVLLVYPETSGSAQDRMVQLKELLSRARILQNPMFLQNPGFFQNPQTVFGNEL